MYLMCGLSVWYSLRAINDCVINFAVKLCVVSMPVFGICVAMCVLNVCVCIVCSLSVATVCFKCGR